MSVGQDQRTHAGGDFPRSPGAFTAPHSTSPLFALSLGLAIALTGASAGRVGAQQEGWSEPSLLFESQGTVFDPAIVADRYGQVHAFWSLTAAPNAGIRDRLIYHARVGAGAGSGVPVISARDNVQGLRAVSNGTALALLWSGQWSAFAPPWLSVSPDAWTKPAHLELAHPHAGLTAARDGTLWMIHGSSQNNHVVVRAYAARARRWNAPLTVAGALNPGGAPDATRLAVSAGGTLHAVWAEYQLPTGWPPLGVYYAQSGDLGATWSAPRELAGRGYNEPNVTTGSGQEVYLAWLGAAGTGGRYFQESLDGGRSWRPAVQVEPPKETGGSEGAPNLVVDGAGGLHMLFSSHGRAWYLQRQGTEWSAPECISNRIPRTITHIENPAMAIGLGNQLHVLVRVNQRQVWYMTQRLHAPGIPPEPLPEAPASAALPISSVVATVLLLTTAAVVLFLLLRRRR